MSDSWSVALVSGFVAAGFTTAGTLYIERMKFRTEFRVESAIRLLLKHDKYRSRTFEKIKSYVPGYTDEELRMMLLRSGAVRFSAKNGEYWGLVKRNKHRLRAGTKQVD
ncbi:hypothetical protein [Streptomyces fructofermentans]|uniref:hypothetical protein n=1 Tax=Streptomyces fructofermentans TaxID=152141 RepID=UPI0033E7BD89